MQFLRKGRRKCWCFRY